MFLLDFFFNDIILFIITFLNVLEQFALPSDTLFLHPFPQVIINYTLNLLSDKNDAFIIYYTNDISSSVLDPYKLASEQFNLLDDRLIKQYLRFEYEPKNCLKLEFNNMHPIYLNNVIRMTKIY